MLQDSANFGPSMEPGVETTPSGIMMHSPEHQTLGYELRRVEIPDMSDNLPETYSRRAALRELNDELEKNKWPGPKVSDDGSRLLLHDDNIATTTFYKGENVAAAYEWRRQLVPSALALEALAMKSDFLPTTDIKIDALTRDMFIHAADARSIRSRGALMSELLMTHASDKNPADAQKWLSLACGAARPVLEAAQAVKGSAGNRIDVTLVDYDPVVLDYSASLADSLNAVDSHTELESDLRRTMIARDTLVQQFGEESMDVVDVLGFLEYCPDKAAVNMLRNSYRLTAPGGVLITANMRDDRPEKQIHLRGIGWPGVQMRSSDQIVELAIQAGIDPSDIQAYQPSDGVYTVLKIEKPLLRIVE